MDIRLLVDRLDCVSTVAIWVLREWGHLTPGWTLDQVIEEYHARAQRDAIPLALIALVEGRPVGTASLIAHDMTSRPELCPWLAAVYVLPEQRGQGIGSRLVRSIEQKARLLEIGTLYLMTPDRVAFYQRLGWVEMERTNYRNEDVTLMCKTWASMVKGQHSRQ